MPEKNTVVMRAIFKECRELSALGCRPSLENLTQSVLRLGAPAEINHALSIWSKQQSS